MNNFLLGLICLSALNGLITYLLTRISPDLLAIGFVWSVVTGMLYGTYNAPR